MKLIKLTDEHYIIVDDTQIKIDDWYLDDTNTPRQAITECESYWTHRKNYKKITHSTDINFNAVYYIPLQEVKELIGDIPNPKLIDSMAMRYRHDFGLLKENEKESIRITMKQIWEEVVGLGFYKSDNKDKKYTEAQMRECWRASERFDRPYNEGYAPNFEEFIQSLQPKTEWELEIVDGKLTTTSKVINNT